MQKTLYTQRHHALVAELIHYRERAGMTQTDLATALGEYQSFIARLESGQRRLDVVELLAIAEVLKFNPLTLMRKLTLLSQD